ncbi:hypothetical protein DSO57_1008678 [Entomophthora muscae]|uniref:Uncharacterized protein n=1 Tax=Entomophthora muscae TaxID=34485 RepID=A0ACC2T729_9FUNG|nr:hypothetical protein DSO57_1008678 [Entomophthora muscae]
MQAKYKLLINSSSLLGNDNSSKLVPGYDPGHTLGTGDQEPHMPAYNDPDIQNARKDLEVKEKERVKREAIPYQQERFQVRDKIWVVNHDQHKLEPSLQGPGIVMEIKPSNTYLIKGIGAKTELKHMHHDCICLCKARTAQCNSLLPVPNTKLDQYQACIPNTLKKIPKVLPSSTPGRDVATFKITLSWGINSLSNSPNDSPTNHYVGGITIIWPSFTGIKHFKS